MRGLITSIFGTVLRLVPTTKNLPDPKEVFQHLKEQISDFRRFKEITLDYENSNYEIGIAYAWLDHITIHFDAKIPDGLPSKKELLLWFLNFLELIAEDVKSDSLKNAIEKAKSAIQFYFENLPKPKEELAVITINGKPHLLISYAHGTYEDFTINYYFIPIDSNFSFRDAAQAALHGGFYDYIKKIGGFPIWELPALDFDDRGGQGVRVRFEEFFV